MDPSQVADRYYDALGRAALDEVTGTLTPDCSVDVPGAMLPVPAAFRGWMQAFFDAFPDITHEHGPYDVDGKSVTTQVTVRGTHTAPLVSPDGTIPATNRPIEITATNQMTIADDKIAALTIDFDQAAFMSQLGL